MELAVAPESTRQLGAGTYQLVASLQSPFWQFWGWRGRAESAPLVLTVVTDETPNRQLAGTAAFLYKIKQFAYQAGCLALQKLIRTCRSR